MFGKLREYFAGEQTSLDVDKTGMATAHDLHVATVVVLIEMAGADKEVARPEAEAICVSMQDHFGLGEDEVPELVEIALSAKSEKGKIDEFVKAINENFNPKQRQEILTMVWKVVLADGKIDKFEERFAVQMKTRFQLSDEQAAEAQAAARS